MRQPLLLLAAIALATFAGCAPTSTTLRDTMTIHNPEASRLWIILKEPGGTERVVLCESAWPSTGHPLCTVWPLTPAAQ